MVRIVLLIPTFQVISRAQCSYAISTVGVKKKQGMSLYFRSNHSTILCSISSLQLKRFWRSAREEQEKNQGNVLRNHSGEKWPPSSSWSHPAPLVLLMFYLYFMVMSAGKLVTEVKIYLRRKGVAGCSIKKSYEFCVPSWKTKDKVDICKCKKVRFHSGIWQLAKWVGLVHSYFVVLLTFG